MEDDRALLERLRAGDEQPRRQGSVSWAVWALPEPPPVRATRDALVRAFRDLREPI